MVVVSAGNSGSSLPLYPGNSTDVLSVTCFDPDGSTISSYANGAWVDVAARGAEVVGPVPGGLREVVRDLDGRAAGVGAACPHPVGGAGPQPERPTDGGDWDVASAHDHAIGHGAIDIEASLQWALDPDH